jgi:A/G-specific adenine glycosylase
MMEPAFAARLLDWHAVHGRHDLPWQQPRTPYRVWLSEVMLQQTQVATVIGYFVRFVDALPTLPDLARADLDQVLALWAGLGYYSRARNLHAAAQRCVERHGGELPTDIEALAALPGIGRSTAGAILAQAHGQRHAILDANVRRVLARHARIEDDVASTPVRKRLWALAESLLPESRLADYTQALMDLGATVCTPRKPRCTECPVQADCGARAAGVAADLPRKRAARTLPRRETCLVLLRDGAGRMLLERRPPSGIWGGLWSLPEAADAQAARTLVEARLGVRADFAALPAFEHAFTHFRLRMTPLAASVHAPASAIGDHGDLRWVDRDARAALGLPRPIATLLERIDSQGWAAAHPALHASTTRNPACPAPCSA